MDWEFNLPEQCPPANARQDEIEVYRLVKNSPPDKEDFFPLSLESKTPHQDFDDFKKCCSHGVSVFKDIKCIKRTQRRYKKLKKQKITKGVITKEDGLLLETFSGSHVTWWIASDKEPHKRFSEVRENVAA